jgi:hypothetical protein
VGLDWSFVAPDSNVATQVTDSWWRFSGCKRAGHQVDHSGQSSLKVNNEWSYGYISLCAFIVCTGTAFILLLLYRIGTVNGLFVKYNEVSCI